MSRDNWEYGAAALLAVGIVATGIAKLTTVHESRQRFAELQELQREQDRLQEEWSALEIEQGMLAAHGRVEQIARDELGFIEPSANRSFVEVLPVPEPPQ
ncbi:MAG: cell division protein FtsL [Gammaproteobacteria bacterium]|nr:cell division protein FtsL [Gammaproteobacteria bacterium]